MLHELAARQSEDGMLLLVGGGLKAEQVAPLRAVGATGFHVGSAVRPSGWAGPVDAEAVRAWANLV